ncbi:MAG TPA: universal stress protein [Azospirillaceae bacterium]|nr:universal stress protein [Azospirillaceae bacterium]
MTIKTLLVPLTGTDADRGALATAIAAARPFGAHVDGLFVRVDPRDAVPLLGEGMSGAMVDEIMRAAEAESSAAAARARQIFEQAAADAGVPLVTAPGQRQGMSARWCEVTGREDEVVSHEGRLRDLLVFSHVAMDRDSPAYVTVETALLGAARPLLLSPAKMPTSIGTTVVVAWNGGLESTRAVVGALPFLRHAETVHILTAETAVTEASTAERLAEYLAWQDIPARIATIKPGAEAVGAALLARAGDLGADLVVMGGYGHSRMREMILGGVTRYVFSHAGLPVLMAH